MEYTTSDILSLVSHVHSSSQTLANNRLGGKDGLVTSHGYILYLLSKNDSLSMTQISEAINRDKSTTTVLVRKLKEKGYIKDVPNKEDARSKSIVLTAKGRKMNTLTQQVSDSMLETCWDKFSEKEKNDLLKLLKKLSANIDNCLE